MVPVPGSPDLPVLEAYNLELSTNLRVNISGNWSAYDFAKFMGSLDDLYNAHVLLQERASSGQHEQTVPTTSTTLRRAVVAISPELQLRVVRIEHASPGVTDFAGIGKGMEEFRRFVFGVWDRFRDKPRVKLDLEKEEFELEESKREAIRKAQQHALDMEQKRQTNRRLTTEADVAQFGLYKELHDYLVGTARPGEFERLVALLQAREDSLGSLITAGKITQVQQIEGGEKSAVG